MAAAFGATALKKPDIEKEAQHISNGDVKVNNWSQSGPAAFDFRSKSFHASLYFALPYCTLLDRLY